MAAQAVNGLVGLVGGHPFVYMAEVTNFGAYPAVLVVLVGGLGGCARLESTDALVSPVVAQGLYLGMDLPDGIDFEGTDILAYSAACSVFLAYVSDPAELADSPVAGADVSFRSEANGRLDLTESGDGEYIVTAAEGLVYEQGDVSSVALDVSGESASIVVKPPQAPDFDFPAAVTKGEAFTVDLTGQGYDSILAAVYDVGRSKVTWTNLPEGVEEIYTYTHPVEPLETLEIPGDAFPGHGSYVVGVAGMRLADPEDFVNVNTTLSAFMAGELSLYVTIIQ